MSQERASSKRFPKMSLPKPSRIAHDWALLGRSTSANLHTIFVVYKIMGRIFVPGCGCWVCNRAAVVDGGSICQSPHSRLRRQYGVIHNVTARAVNIAGYQHFAMSLSQKPQKPQRWVIGSHRFIGFIRFFCVNQRFLREIISIRNNRCRRTTARAVADSAI